MNDKGHYKRGLVNHCSVHSKVRTMPKESCGTRLWSSSISHYYDTNDWENNSHCSWVPHLKSNKCQRFLLTSLYLDSLVYETRRLTIGRVITEINQENLLKLQYLNYCDGWSWLPTWWNLESSRKQIPEHVCEGLCRWQEDTVWKHTKIVDSTFPWPE